MAFNHFFDCKIILFHRPVRLVTVFESKYVVKDISALIWHLECKRLALTTIDTFVPPADSFQMRMHHSLYIVNVMSAIDMVNEHFDASFRQFLESRLGIAGMNGDEVLSYVRELRNGAVHRGEDLTRIVTVINGVNRAVAPETVSTRNGAKTYSAPLFLLRDLFEHLENIVGPAMKQVIFPYINQPDSRSSEAILRDFMIEVDKISFIPQWTKDALGENLTIEMLCEAHAHSISKLNDLLRPPVSPFNPLL